MWMFRKTQKCLPPAWIWSLDHPPHSLVKMWEAMMLEVPAFSNLYHLQTTMLTNKTGLYATTASVFICCLILLMYKQWDKPHKKVLFGETSIYEIMCFLSTGTTSHWSTTKLLWHIKTTVLWSDWRKMQNFTVAVAKDYMLTNKV